MRSTLGGSVLVAAVVAGCWTSSSTPRTLTPPVRDAGGVTLPLVVELAVEPTTLTMATRDRLRVRFKVTNASGAALDPKLDDSQLLVNNTPTYLWGNAVSNGGVTETWYSLPPGGAIERELQYLGPMLAAPGDYTLVLDVAGVTSAPRRVTVQP